VKKFSRSKKTAEFCVEFKSVDKIRKVCPKSEYPKSEGKIEFFYILYLLPEF
jgi:hypothetical protein